MKGVSNLRALAFCLLIVAICYSNALPLPFVQPDDFLIVASNPAIRSITPLRFLSEPYWAGYKFGGVYRPLTILSFSLDYAVWHRWASGYRLTNLLLHALNGWLVFLLASLLIGSAGAWAAAAVYLFHPIHTEAIVGIVGRAELLAAAFFFSAWLMFRRDRSIWAGVFFFLSLLSKENAIILPAILILDVWITSSSKEKRWRDFVPVTSAMFVYLALRVSVLGSLGVPPSDQYMQGGLSLLQRWMTSGRVFLQYFRLVLAPIDVAASYEVNSIHIATLRDWDAWAGIAAVALSVLTGGVLARRRPAIGLPILFFFVALLPVSNWILPIGVLMAERFLYIPVFSVALLSGVGWTALANNRQKYLVGTGALVIAALLCVSHNWVWQNEFTFFKNMVRVTPDNLTARNGFGLVLQNKGNVEQAREQFEAGLRIDPNSPVLLSSLAGLLMQTDARHCEKARPLLERALTARPNYWQSSWFLANCYVLKGDREHADTAYRQAVENAPYPDPNLLFSWGTTLEALGKSDAAIDAYRRAAVISPDDPEIQQKLAALVVSRAH